EYLNKKAETLREQHVLSKQVLACLRDASASILSRAEYLPAARDNKTMAGKFDMLLDLMIRGETLTDRQPGVPRII
ncbi:MAG TPA: hypothetical protein VFW13_06765, partial [Phenylobacterium sp.]|nr:hypothetical protein [Phenylobacterium sp.]